MGCLQALAAVRLLEHTRCDERAQILLEGITCDVGAGPCDTVISNSWKASDMHYVAADVRASSDASQAIAPKHIAQYKPSALEAMLKAKQKVVTLAVAFVAWCTARSTKPANMREVDKHPAQLDPSGQPGKRAAQCARQKARAWLDNKRNWDDYLDLLSELKGFSDVIVMALEGELRLNRKVKYSRRRRRLAWVLCGQYRERSLV